MVNDEQVATAKCSQGTCVADVYGYAIFCKNPLSNCNQILSISQLDHQQPVVFGCW